ncbi:MAG: tRNA (N6-threonylcarbamoyladenosine(37)-N6)-methyltransferase TrmO [Methanomassiliicoccales archaeon]|nr:MAG: tRNA (N6-threonylcarbamoyladenosine(37)-N6)-methyltransferase TrmO [Methanomassiliicoccales archaeon]
MREKKRGMRIEPIGRVICGFEDEIPKDYENHISEVVISSEYSKALHRIEVNSHILVIFWMDRVEGKDRKTLRVHPKGRKDLPLMGVFATRSPMRPNPIGIRAVKLLGKEENVLKVKGLDALNGTPVLDIKPYSMKHDFVINAKSPKWAKNTRPREE